MRDAWITFYLDPHHLPPLYPPRLRTRLIAMLDGGASFEDCHRHFHVSMALLKIIVKQNNRADLLAYTGRYPDRDREVIRRREAGETLQQIGDTLGVTRERIRQIILRLDRPDLAGVRLTQRRIEKYCIVCGAEFGLRLCRARAEPRATCSAKCLGQTRPLTDLEASRGPVVFAMRLQGHTWEEISVFFRLSMPGLHHQLRRWGRKTGTDVSAAYPGVNYRRTEKHKRAMSEGHRRRRERQAVS